MTQTILPPPPPRQLDIATLEDLDDVVDADCPDRSCLRSRDFPELYEIDVRSSDVQVVLYDYNSMDSFAACWAAQSALGKSVVCYGVNRSTIVEDLTVDVGGKVVAMLGICWPLEVMHDLALECRWLFILDNHISIARELQQFTYPQAVPIIETQMGAGALAWNFFHPQKHVPALFRAIEDAELGRRVLRDSEFFAIGFEATCGLEKPRGEVQPFDEAFADFEKFLSDDGGRATISDAISQARELEPGLQAQCREAAASYAVVTLNAFPAWRCALANVSSPLSDKVAESLIEHFVAANRSAEDTCLQRCYAAVFEVKWQHVRVVLRSLPGGPDVSEIAALYEGCGHHNRAFFSVRIDLWDTLWIQPETVLWDVTSKGPRCLNLKEGDTVTVAKKGERFRNSPFDEWSWGYKISVDLEGVDATAEGWIPTLAHTLWVATRSIASPGAGVASLEEGDILVAKAQRGQFLWGVRYRSNISDNEHAWFPKVDDALHPVSAASVKAFLASLRM